MLNSRGFFGVLVGALVFMAGCAQPAQQQAAAPPEEYAQLKVMEVDQLSKLDTKKADGQYVVALLDFRNISKEDLSFNAAEVKVKYAADDDEKEQYSQGIETGLVQPFVKTYGEDKKDMLLELAKSSVHPNLNVQRYAIFQLPKDARLEDYVVVYTPPAAAAGLFGGNNTPKKAPVEVKLQDADTPVNDRRELE